MAGIERVAEEAICKAVSSLLFFGFLVAFLSMFFNAFIHYNVSIISKRFEVNKDKSAKAKSQILISTLVSWRKFYIT